VAPPPDAQWARAALLRACALDLRAAHVALDAFVALKLTGDRIDAERRLRRVVVAQLAWLLLAGAPAPRAWP
jgi:hypothetical protein